jgi:CRP/FNR family cyclic AMP-dependent transcriptional regulator
MTNEGLNLRQLLEDDLPVVHFDAGETIFLEDDLGDGLYVIVSGLVNIVTYGQPLENVGPSGIIGEISLIDNGPRSASAMAAVDTKALKIDRETFLDLVRREPKFALHVMRALAMRARRNSPEQSG